MGNFELFKQYLKSIDVVLEEGNTEDANFFAIENTIPSGPRVRLVIIMDHDDKRVTILSFNYVSINNPSKKEYFLEKVNELNLNYAFNKFVIDEHNNIGVNVFLPINNNFDAESVWLLAIGAYRALEDEYKGFMKILWG